MDELLNLKIKVTMNSMTGFVTIVGKVVKSIDHFLLLDTTIGPIYISHYAIKTIQVLGDHHETK